MPESQQETSAVAREYATALMALAGELPAAAAIGEELDAVVGLESQVDGLAEMLASPVLTAQAKTAIVDKALRGNVSDLLADFMCVLARNQRGGMLADVARAYHGMLNARRNRIDVSVTTAVPMDESQQRALAAALGGLLGAEPVLRMQVDPEALGGFRVVVGDRVLDATVREQLDELRGYLAAGKTI